MPEFKICGWVMVCRWSEAIVKLTSNSSSLVTDRSQTWSWLKTLHIIRDDGKRIIEFSRLISITSKSYLTHLKITSWGRLEPNTLIFSNQRWWPIQKRIKLIENNHGIIVQVEHEFTSGLCKHNLNFFTRRPAESNWFMLKHYPSSSEGIISDNSRIKCIFSGRYAWFWNK